MSKQVMLVSTHGDETRIALTKENILVGLHMEHTHGKRTVGNIYKGTIVKVNPAFQAAFVDYGESRNGFLSLSDVNLSLFKGGNDNKGGRPRIQSVLREGQTVMVQVLKEGLKNKGSALTTFVSLPGRFMVLSPNSDRTGVSRKIEDQEVRRRLKDMLEALQAGEDLGIIIRTAGIDQPVTELKRDLDGLRKQWHLIQDKFKSLKKPGQVYQESSPIVRVLRDFFNDDVEEVWVDDPEAFQEALKYFKSALPRFQKRLKLYVGDKSLFAAYNIESQIEQLDSSRVLLPSGGSIVMETTEALVTVDVNSGRSNRASDIEETALHTNLEAAREIARQLRLRNLGGLVVIDFIDMMSQKNRRKVEETLTESLKGDKARTTLGTISQFGLLEMSRQRVDMETTRGLRVQCPTCAGTGHVPTVQAFSNNVLRKARQLAATGRYTQIEGEVPLECANYLFNNKREALRDLELEFGIIVNLEVNPEMTQGAPLLLTGVRQGEGEGDDADGGETQVEGVRESVNGSAEMTEHRHRRRRRGQRGNQGIVAGMPVEEQESPVPSITRREPFSLDDDKQQTDTQPFEKESARFARPETPDEDDSDSARQPRREHGPRSGHGGKDRPGRHEGKGGRDSRGPREDRGQGSSPGGFKATLLFQSHHEITDQEAVEKLPPRMVRSRPFAALGPNIQPDTVLFQSTHVGEDTGPKADAATDSRGDGLGKLKAGEPMSQVQVRPKAAESAEAGNEKTEGGRRRRRGRGRGKSAGKAKGVQAAPDASSSDLPEIGNEAVKKPQANAGAGRGRAHGKAGGNEKKSESNVNGNVHPAAQKASSDTGKDGEAANGGKKRSRSRRRRKPGQGKAVGGNAVQTGNTSA